MYMYMYMYVHVYSSQCSGNGADRYHGGASIPAYIHVHISGSLATSISAATCSMYL